MYACRAALGVLLPTYDPYFLSSALFKKNSKPLAHDPPVPPPKSFLCMYVCMYVCMFACMCMYVLMNDYICVLFVCRV